MGIIAPGTSRRGTRKKPLRFRSIIKERNIAVSARKKPLRFRDKKEPEHRCFGSFIAKTVDKQACIAPLPCTCCARPIESIQVKTTLQKGGVPATPSGTATLLRLSPSHRFCPRPFLPVADFRHPQLPWLDGRCVQGPGTYSPHHG